jgi:pyruvate,orthophosphate dikinase
MSQLVHIHSTRIITVVFLLLAAPFVTINQEGVGELVKLAAERGKETRKGIKLGICGDLGSIHFCQSVGPDYVSCSPYRVPIARLAAALEDLS